jgi:hypothetical protein
MRRLFMVLFAFFLTIPCFSQAKHPFTFEDMMRLKRVGAPQPSPDGKWVLFSAVDVDLEANATLGAGWQALRVHIYEEWELAVVDCRF